MVLPASLRIRLHCFYFYFCFVSAFLMAEEKKEKNSISALIKMLVSLL